MIQQIQRHRDWKLYKLRRTIPFRHLLHAHLHRNARMRIVPFHHNILANKVINILHLAVQPQLWEWFRFSLQLNFQRVYMVPIDMCIAQLDDELVRFCVCDVSDHVS